MFITCDEFISGDALELYSRMRPDQRTAIANEFVRHLILAGDPDAKRFNYAAHDPLAAPDQVQQAERPTGETAPPVIPELMSAAQVAQIHQYTCEHHPELVEDVMRHPVTQSALAAPGAPAAPLGDDVVHDADSPTIAEPHALDHTSLLDWQTAHGEHSTDQAPRRIG